MMEIFEQSEAMWKGEIDPADLSPFEAANKIVKIAYNTWFFKGYSNIIVRATDHGLIIVDPGGFSTAASVDGHIYAVNNIQFNAIRSVTTQRLHTAIYTHGHVDHIHGARIYEEESRLNHWPPPQVIAHENILARFKRYKELPPKMLHHSNPRFQAGQSSGLVSTTEFLLPNFLYKTDLDIRICGIKTLIRHDRGETDDHTWVFFPDTGVLCTGDFFTWSLPGTCNLQESQCFFLDWARALRKMASLKPEILAPGHGLLVIGEDRVIEALDHTATLLESVHSQALSLMNKGATLDIAMQSIRADKRLVSLPYLQPVCGDIEFIVRSIWQSYGGWYDGTPSRLKPAKEKEQGAEIARLAGGPGRLIKRAKELMSKGNLSLACHLVEWACSTCPGQLDFLEIRRQIYGARASAEASIIAKGVFRTAAENMQAEPKLKE